MNNPQIPVLSMKIQSDQDISLVRLRVRQLASQLGFDVTDLTRFGLVVSEIAGFVLRLVGGEKVEYRVDGELFLVCLYAESQENSSLADLLDAGEDSPDQTQARILDAKRWLDHYIFQPIPGDGIRVELGKVLPPNAIRPTPQELTLEIPEWSDPGFIEEFLRQDEEILHYLAEIKAHREKLAGLNRELEETNRGVVALYAELEEQAAHLRLQANVLEMINDAVIVSDLSYRITSWNHGAEILYGWKEEEVLGKLVSEILRSELTQEQRASFYQRLAEGNPVVTELVQYTRDNRQLIASGYTVPFWDNQGKIAGYVVANYDITQRKQSEEELQSYAARLEKSNRDLQDFASIISHDLQEPLRKIRSFGDMLKAKAGARLDQDELDYLLRMQNASERMNHMIEDILAYSRVTTQAQPPRWVDLAVVVAEVLSDLEIRMDQTQGRVEIGDLPAIHADPQQMRQLFQNLIGNALKFHKPNVPPVVKVQSIALPDNRVEITIEDNGIGFSMENIDKLFLPFHRLHGRSEYEGNGIGLSICRKIVERHDGSITAQSEVGKGSIFTVVLPM